MEARHDKKSVAVQKAAFEVFEPAGMLISRFKTVISFFFLIIEYEFSQNEIFCIHDLIWLEGSCFKALVLLAYYLYVIE